MVNVWLLDVSLSFRLSLSMESRYLVFQLVQSVVSCVLSLVWMSERDIYMWIQICPLKWDKFEFQRPSATLYLLLQSVADSMVVAVAFPDFSGFLAFRAPNIGFPKSGSNGSFLELIFLVLTLIRGICLFSAEKSLALWTFVLRSNLVTQIWFWPSLQRSKLVLISRSGSDCLPCRSVLVLTSSLANYLTI